MGNTITNVGKALGSAAKAVGDFVSFPYNLIHKILAGGKAPVHVQEMTVQQKEEYPRPHWLPTHGLNWLVCGEAGVGKSSLINALRGYLKKGDPAWAETSVAKGTQEPTPYKFPDCPEVILWDLPGAGADGFLCKDYIVKFGLRYGTGVLIVVDDRWKEIYGEIVAWLEHFHVPYYIIRTKMDHAVEANEADKGMTKEQTIAEVRQYVQGKVQMSSPKCSASRIYLVSARESQATLGDWEKFYQDLTADLKKSYGV